MKRIHSLPWDGILKQYSLYELKERKVRFDVNSPDIEGLKYAFLRNFSLLLKENLSDEEPLELKVVNAFIELYNISE